jgi:phosphoribosylformylglycinamidine synthase subunit PurSL
LNGYPEEIDVSVFVRIEVAKRPEFKDPVAEELLRKIALAHPELRRDIRWARLLEVYWLEVPVDRDRLIAALREIFHDPVLQWLFTGNLIPSAAGKSGNMQDLMEASPTLPGKFWGIERHYRTGVTDNVGRTVLEALEIIFGEKLQGAHAASGSLLLVEGADLMEDHLAVIARDVFCNELIQSWTLLGQDELRKSGRFHPDQIRFQLPKVSSRVPKTSVGTYSFENWSEGDLLKESHKRLWALNSEEMKAIQTYFDRADVKEKRAEVGLSNPTDVEMEVLAQTWSEHCKHKIFNAKIQYEDLSQGSHKEKIPSTIDSLFKQTISAPTAKMDRSWLLSVFSDNAGISVFDDEDAFCVKVETHNSPSALDPYGGALTGIVGVNRDIMGCGKGAKPIFNMDVFCVAAPEGQKKLPERIMSPRRILQGVRKGVEDGGNKSGIPTINGALVFDHRYLGKPLVYCGTVGMMPRKIHGRPIEKKEIKVGDHICMVGGRIGKDGIHGATFSSLALDKDSPTTAVQLGDPITQKRAMDFILEARDQNLYRTLTDNGAGGLSSSVGELAEITGGARMDVSLAKTKYPGLKPYELVVSESQERMTVAVPPNRLEAFCALAERRGSEVSVLGEFTDSGYFEIFHGDKRVAHLELDFLHKGVPQLELSGKWRGGSYPEGVVRKSFQKEGCQVLLEILSRPNIASKEWLIRQYDHEVQGASVVKPLHTAFPGTAQEWSGPNDAGVVQPKPHSSKGLAIGNGINPKLSDVDPYLMAQAVVDEAIRNVLCVGAEFGTEKSIITLVDNFCWPDPVGDEGKTADLVRACYGMREAVLALGVPLISGKDSMKNDYHGKRDGKPVVISVPPTLLMTAVGRVPDVKECRTADFKEAEDRIYLLGGRKLGLLGSELHALYQDRLREKGGSVSQAVLPVGDEQSVHRAPKADWDMAHRMYSWFGGARGKKQVLLKSAHDVSEGGLLASIAESLLARGLGARIQLPLLEMFESQAEDLWETAFGEGFHSFVVSIGKHDADLVEREWRRAEIPFSFLGEVTESNQLAVSWEKRGSVPEGSWKVSVSELRQAWKREGYWE